MTKEEATKLNRDGWEFIGVECELISFQKEFKGFKTKISNTTWKITPTTYAELRILEEDIKNGSIDYLFKHGLTR